MYENSWFNQLKNPDVWAFTDCSICQAYKSKTDFCLIMNTKVCGMCPKLQWSKDTCIKEYKKNKIRDIILSLDTFTAEEAYTIIGRQGIQDRELIQEVLKNMQNDGEIAFKNNYIVLGS